MSRFMIIFAVLVAMVAALAMASSPPKWTQQPGSPNARRTIKDAGGQQIDHTVNHGTGQVSSGYLALGKNARESSPIRTGQPSSGGPASTSQKKGKGKGK
ncbi:hypothetical protein FOCC_FOCC006139 [Frankliniella occidentalis]|nr:hypothetical protein FOCC_FOCC006139 [Frankliniella occidentalis]